VWQLGLYAIFVENRKFPEVNSRIDLGVLPLPGDIVGSEDFAARASRREYMFNSPSSDCGPQA
jgi:hypothetical protein